MPRSNPRDTNNMKYQVSIFSPKAITPLEMLANENCLEELQDTEDKRTYEAHQRIQGV